eukprot:SM008531S23423  [mRNA]  locus=s8531:115:580:- [translate_table: standard]
MSAQVFDARRKQGEVRKTRLSAAAGTWPPAPVVSTSAGKPTRPDAFLKPDGKGKPAAKVRPWR